MAFHHDIDPKPSNKFTKEEIPAQCQKLITGQLLLQKKVPQVIAWNNFDLGQW